MYKDSKEYTDKVISRFPHMYRRDNESNNYFLLEIYLEEIRQASQSLYELLESLDILKAKGYVLDKFGNTFNLKRKNRENDNIYRQRILAELASQTKNATFETLLNVLKIIVEDIEQNIFIFEEGVRKTTGSHNINGLNVFKGSFGSNNLIKENFETKGGTLYLILNKRLPSYLRNSIKNTLLDIRAKGIELTIDFKYKVQTANYISGGAFLGTKRILHITDSFYDEISQIKNYETNLARINLITQEGVR